MRSLSSEQALRLIWCLLQEIFSSGLFQWDVNGIDEQRIEEVGEHVFHQKKIVSKQCISNDSRARKMESIKERKVSFFLKKKMREAVICIEYLLMRRTNVCLSSEKIGNVFNCEVCSLEINLRSIDEENLMRLSSVSLMSEVYSLEINLCSIDEENLMRLSSVEV